jgi:hypothetical protein
MLKVEESFCNNDTLPYGEAVNNGFGFVRFTFARACHGVVRGVIGTDVLVRSEA